MQIKAWRFIAILFTALLMTQGFAHVWQLPSRLAYEGVLWFDTLTFYVRYGPEGPGPFIEVAAFLTTLVLLFLVRRRRPAFTLTLVAVVALALSTAAWWAFIYPVNRELLRWTADTLPQNWTAFRDQWEYTHSARAVLMFIALGALLYSLIYELPNEPPASSTPAA